MSCIGVIGELKKSTQFEWKIADFFSLSSQKGYFYISPSFVFQNTSFRLKLWPGGSPNAKIRFVSLFLENETDDNPHCVTVALHIKEADGTLTGFEDTTKFPFSNNKLFGYREFYSRISLEESKSKYVPSGILTIICTMLHDDTLAGKQAPIKAENSDQQRFIELDDLSESFRRLSTNKDSCDVILQVEDKEFKAHKVILMARSSVFAAMFQHDTLEKQIGFINIPDCDSESFQKFLDFLYCGKLEEVSFRYAFHLYGTSVKYDVEKLKELCSAYLIKNLAVGNVCDIIKLADKYDDEKLIKETQNFFNKNWDKIFPAADWDNLLTNNLRLAKKVLVEMSKNKSSQ